VVSAFLGDSKGSAFTLVTAKEHWEFLGSAFCCS
jgi:hypothetical protein